MVTPFTEQGNIDFEALEKLLIHCEPVQYFVIMGTTGESVTLSSEEKKQLLDFVIQKNI